jgi:hypothetical protein
MYFGEHLDDGWRRTNCIPEAFFSNGKGKDAAAVFFESLTNCGFVLRGHK